MRPTFLGFEVARTALNASQKGLDVTSQNIANVNTEGYTRQKLEQSAISAEYGAFLYAETDLSGVGQGVNVGSIRQLRDQFIDNRYRREYANNQSWNAALKGLLDIESVIDEISTNGLNETLMDFYQKLQTFSLNTTSIENASLLRSAAQKVTQVLNKYAERLDSLQQEKALELSIAVNDINGILTKITEMNTRIRDVIISGYNPNELLDARNVYLDQLSGYINITVQEQADGTIVVKSGNTVLIDSNQNIRRLSVDNSNGVYQLVDSDGQVFEPAEGAVYGHLQLLNGQGLYSGDPENAFRGIPYYQKAYDDLARQFAEVFNAMNAYDGQEKPLFVGDANGEITAASIKISTEWLADAMYITSTTQVPASPGQNDNIIAMLQKMNQPLAITPFFNGTFEEFVTSLNSEIAVDVKYYQDMAKSSDMVLLVISDQRDSVMGVSIDEEVINMVKYQKSYTAAARMMTVLDEMLDVIINRMGIIGR